MTDDSERKDPKIMQLRICLQIVICEDNAASDLSPTKIMHFDGRAKIMLNAPFLKKLPTPDPDLSQLKPVDVTSHSVSQQVAQQVYSQYAGQRRRAGAGAKYVNPGESVVRNSVTRKNTSSLGG